MEASCPEVRVRFTGLETNGISETVYPVADDGTTARIVAGRNKRIQLKARTSGPLVEPGDVLIADNVSAASMAVEADGSILVAVPRTLLRVLPPERRRVRVRASILLART